jgi:hypothetical protein
LFFSRKETKAFLKKEKRMKKYAILFALFALGTTHKITARVDSRASDLQVNRGGGRPGENWVMLSRRAIDEGAVSLTIDLPGNYMITESFLPDQATTALIDITADDVILDFGGHTLRGDGTNQIAGVRVTGTPYNVTIRNGGVRDLTGVGVSIANGASNITIENFSVNNADLDAFDFVGTANNVLMKNVTVVGSAGANASGKGIETGGIIQNFVVDGFRIDHLAATDRPAINITGGSYGIVLKNGKISDISGGAASNGITLGAACYDVDLENITISNVAGNAIDLSSILNVRVKNLTIDNVTGGAGITSTSPNDSIVLENINISNTSANGLDIGSIASSPMKGVSCKNLILSDITGTALLLTGRPDGLIVDGIQISNASVDGIQITNRAHGAIMRNIMISDSGNKGINILGMSQDFLIEDFVIAESGATAIDFVASCTAVTIRRGNITTPTTDGIRIKWESNSFDINDVKISVAASDGIVTESGCNNIKIRNCEIAAAGDSGMTFAVNCNSIDIENCLISCDGSGSGITFNNNLYNTSITKCAIANVLDGIVFGNNNYGVAVKDFKISNHTNDGIRFGTGAHGVAIKGGTISSANETHQAIDMGTSAYGINIEDVTVNGGGDGFKFVGTAGTATVVTDVTVKNCHLSNGQAVSAKGIQFDFAENILIQDTTVGKCSDVGATSNVVGVYFTTCTNVKCVNVESGGHIGRGAQGFMLTAVNSALFDNCSSQGNYAQDTVGTDTCAGFLVITSTGVKFNDCVSSGHSAKREAMGWLLANAIGCEFKNCTSLGIRHNHALSHEHPRFAGFYSMNGVGNSWKNCVSDNHFAGNAAVADGDGAMGYYLSSESQSTFFQCKARGSGGWFNHTANATGFYLDDTVGAIVPTGVQMATSDCQFCTVRDCEASANITSATGTDTRIPANVTAEQPTWTAYGFRDDSTNTTNVIMECVAFSNTDKTIPTRIVTNYWMDLPYAGTDKRCWPITTGDSDSLIEFANLPFPYSMDIQ